MMGIEREHSEREAFKTRQLLTQATAKPHSSYHFLQMVLQDSANLHNQSQISYANHSIAVMEQIIWLLEHAIRKAGRSDFEQ
jgi:hypothetical protein